MGDGNNIMWNSSVSWLIYTTGFGFQTQWLHCTMQKFSNCTDSDSDTISNCQHVNGWMELEWVPSPSMCVRTTDLLHRQLSWNWIFSRTPGKTVRPTFFSSEACPKVGFQIFFVRSQKIFAQKYLTNKRTKTEVPENYLEAKIFDKHTSRASKFLFFSPIP